MLRTLLLFVLANCFDAAVGTASKYVPGFPSVTSVTTKSFTVNVQLKTTTGTLYYIIVPDNCAHGIPSSAQVRQGKDGASILRPANKRGSMAIPKSITTFSFTVDSDDVYAQTSVDVYLVVVDVTGSVDVSPTKLDVTTATASTTASVTTITSSSATLSVVPTGRTKVLYGVTSSGATATANDIRNKLSGKGAVGTVVFAGSFWALNISVANTLVVKGLSSATTYGITVVPCNEKETVFGTPVALSGTFKTFVSATFSTVPTVTNIAPFSFTATAATATGTDRIYYYVVQRDVTTNTANPYQWASSTCCSLAQQAQAYSFFTSATGSASITLPGSAIGDLRKYDVFFAVADSAGAFFGAPYGPVRFTALSSSTLTPVAKASSTVNTITFTYTANIASSSGYLYYAVVKAGSQSLTLGSQVFAAYTTFTSIGANGTMVLGGRKALATGAHTSQTVVTGPTVLDATTKYDCYFAVAGPTDTFFSAVVKLANQATSDGAITAVAASLPTATGWTQTFTATGTGKVMWAALIQNSPAPTCAEMASQLALKLSGQVASMHVGYKAIGETVLTAAAGVTQVLDKSNSQLDAGSTYDLYYCHISRDRQSIQAAAPYAGATGTSTAAGVVVNDVKFSARTATSFDVTLSADGTGKVAYGVYGSSGNALPATAAALLAKAQANIPSKAAPTWELAFGIVGISEALTNYTISVPITNWGVDVAVHFYATVVNIAESSTTAGALYSNTADLRRPAAAFQLEAGYPLTQDSDFSQTQIAFRVKLSSNTGPPKIHYAVLAGNDDGANALTDCATLSTAGKNKLAVGVASYDTGAASEKTITITGLTAATAYDVYYCISDSGSTEFSDVKPRLDLKTYFATVASSLSNTYPKWSGIQPYGADLEISYQANFGSFMYVLQRSTAAAPVNGNAIKALVKAGAVSGDVAAVGSVVVNFAATVMLQNIRNLEGSASYILYYVAANGWQTRFSNVGTLTLTTGPLAFSEGELTTRAATLTGFELVANLNSKGKVLFFVRHDWLSSLPSYSTVAAQVAAGPNTLHPAVGEVVVTANSTDFAAKVTGLDPGTVYYVYAYAANLAGTTSVTPDQPVYNVSTLINVGFESSTPAAVYSSLTHTAVSFSAVTTAPGNVWFKTYPVTAERPSKGFDLENANPFSSVAASEAGSAVTCALTGLTAATAYHLYFAIEDNSDLGMWSDVYGPFAVQTLLDPSVVAADAGATKVSETTTVGFSLDLKRSGSFSGYGSAVVVVMKASAPRDTVKTGEMLWGVFNLYAFSGTQGTIYDAVANITVPSTSVISDAFYSTDLDAGTDYVALVAFSAAKPDFFTAVTTLPFTTDNCTFLDNTPEALEPDVHGLRLRFRLDGHAKVYWVVLTEGSVVPSADEIKAMVERGSVGTLNLHAKGTTLVTANNTDFFANVSGLTAATGFDVYGVALNREGGGSPSEIPYARAVNSIKTITGAKVLDWKISSVTTTTLTLHVKASAIGRAYFNILTKGSVHDASGTTSPCDGYPSYAGTGNVQTRSVDVTSANSFVSLGITGLSADTSYDIYLCFSDPSSSFWASVPSKKSVATRTAVVWAQDYPAVVNGSKVNVDGVASVTLGGKMAAGTSLNGDIYYLVLHGSMLDPLQLNTSVDSPEDFFNLFSANSSLVHAQGNFSFTGDNLATFSVSNLRPNTAYHVATLLATKGVHYTLSPIVGPNFTTPGEIYSVQDSSGNVLNKIDGAVGGSAVAVTINGAGFGTANPIGVWLGPEPGERTPATVTSISNNKLVISAQPPNNITGTGLGDIVLQLPDDNSVTPGLDDVIIYKNIWATNGGKFRVSEPVSPASGPAVGTNRVTLHAEPGYTLGAGNDITSVTFGGVAANIVTQTSTSVTVAAGAAPASIIGKPVAVVLFSVSKGYSAVIDGYTYNPAPTIVSITPNVGSSAGGTLVTITGTGLGTAGDVCIVTLNGIAAKIQPGQTSTQVVVEASDGSLYSGTADVKVTSTSRGTVTSQKSWTYHSGCCWRHPHTYCDGDVNSDPKCQNIVTYIVD